MCCFFSVIKIQTIFEYSRDDSKSVEKLENWKIEKYNYFCENACYEQSTNELEIITVIPFSLMINSNQ